MLSLDILLLLARLGPQVHTDKTLQSLLLDFEYSPTNREKMPISPYKMWNLNNLSHQPDIFHSRHMNLGECNLKDDTALKSCIRDEQNGGLSPAESPFEFHSLGRVDKIKNQPS